MNPDTTPQFVTPPLLPAWREAEVFRRLRIKTLLAAVERMFETARLRLALVTLLSFMFWFGLLVLFLEGFQYLAGAYVETIQTLFNVFFASLMMMLMFSAGLILYSGLFRSRETAFLLTTPTRIERIFLYKFQEAVWFSSWGFVLLGSPMMVAYGVVADAPWHYFAMLIPFILAFVYMQAAIGAIVCLLIVRLIPRIRMHMFIVLSALTISMMAWAGWVSMSGMESELLTPRWFQEISSRLRIAEARLLPSWWLSSGLLEASRHGRAANLSYQPWAEGVLFLAVLVSNAMLLQLLAVWTARATVRTSFSQLHGARRSRRRVKPALIDRMVMSVGRWLPLPMRLLIVKDLRLFRRDPVQWSQFLIFFSLLGLYFLNIRRFSYDVNYVTYVNMIGFLNVSVVGLILSTFTTRFIYPMISLEGRRFWILGLLPIDRSTILWAKFLFAFGGAALPCTLLILISDLMLGLGPIVMAVHQMTCLTLCVGLSGIAVGLGAKIPDLRQTCPSKIAAGFGGTLNLVFSAAYILLVVGIAGYATHRYVARPTDSAGLLLGGALFCIVLLGAVATLLPMHIGRKAFERLEF